MKKEPDSTPFTLPPPPRNVSRTTELWYIHSGCFPTLAWLFFGFASLMFWFFGRHATPFSPERPRSGNLPIIFASGSLIRIDSDKIPGTIAYYFRYTVDGKTYDGVSYGSDRSLKAGDSVHIDYVRDMPATARIVDMDSKSTDDGIVLAFILPVIFGLLMFPFHRWIFHKEVLLLRYGVLAVATRDKISKIDGESTTYWSEYHFIPYPGHWIKTIASSEYEHTYGDEEQVIYLPDNPDKNDLVKSMTSALKFDEHGNHLIDKRRALLFSCVVPAAVIILNLYFLLITLFR